jgi:2-phospho-L-lactate/phosphoenolpyruvate guanylyltransferase
VNVAAVVPVKALGAAKSRLKAVLDERARATLALWLVDRVVTAVRASGAVKWLAIVSPDASALAWAASAGITALPQHGGDLNDGLELGRQWARAAGAQALLVLLGDLPLLAPGDVRALVALAAETAERDPNPAGVAVLAPDRAGAGTNALLLAPVGALPFAFGPESHRRHLALARRRGLLVATYRAPGTAFDVDRPADLDELCQAGLWPVGALEGPCAAASGRTDGPGI